MKFTLNWLKEFVDFGGPAAELSKLLTSAGFEVESLTPLKEPESQREEGNLERAPVGRSLLYAGLGLLAAVWALASLIAG